MHACPNIQAVIDGTQSKLVIGESSLSTWKFSQDSVRKVVAKMISFDELPLWIVEAKWFRNCMKIVCPKFHMPYKWTIARDCYYIFLDEKNKMKRTKRKDMV